MAVRAWRLWGISAVLAGGMVGLCQAPKSEIGGLATPSITQDYFQPEVATPKVLPPQVRKNELSKNTPLTAGKFTESVFRLLSPGEFIDLDIPIRGSSTGRRIKPFQIGGLMQDWKVRSALDIAEMHFDACELDEARNWYQEVIRLDPDSPQARQAAERLEQTKPNPAASQSSEPPLAVAGPPAVQARVPIR